MTYPASAAAPLESSAIAPTTWRSHTRKIPGKTTRRQPSAHLRLAGDPLGFRWAGRAMLRSHRRSPSRPTVPGQARSDPRRVPAVDGAAIEGQADRPGGDDDPCFCRRPPAGAQSGLAGLDKPVGRQALHDAEEHPARRQRPPGASERANSVVIPPRAGPMESTLIR